MERELSRLEQNDDYEKLLPEIAELMNISVSQLEQYPRDMQQLLCRAYINESALGKDNAANVLNNIINLDIDNIGVKEEEKQQDKPAIDNELSEKEKNARKNKRSFLVSRNQILQNAKTISDNKNSQQNLEQQHTAEFTRKCGTNY